MLVGIHLNFQVILTWLFSTFFFSCSFGVNWKLSFLGTSKMPKLSIIVKTDNVIFVKPKYNSARFFLLWDQTDKPRVQSRLFSNSVIWSKEGGHWDFHSWWKRDQRFLSCTAFSVYEVHLRRLSVAGLIEQTNNSTDERRERLRKH